MPARGPDGSPEKTVWCDKVWYTLDWREPVRERSTRGGWVRLLSAGKLVP